MSTPRPGLRTIIAHRLAALARRVAPQTLADHGYTLPAHLTANPPTNSVMRDLRVAAGKANAAALGIPDTALMNQMLANQAPQAEPVALYAPGAPLLPTPGMETPYGPRQQDYDIGINVAALPRSTEATSFQQLRNLAALYEGIALCKRVWFDTINRLDVKVTFLPGTIPDGQSEKDPKWQKITQPALEFLKYPDRERTIHDWLIASVEDVLDLGQSPIYLNRNRKGDIISLDVIDAATIKPLFDQRGRLPKPPYPAFEQFIKGVPAGLYANQPVMPDEIKSYTASSFVLIREMARTSSIYSRSRVEDIIFRVNQALRKENLDLTRYTDGAVPDGMLFMDDSVAWSQDESEELERQLNNLLGGNDRRKVHLKVIPPGIKSYQSTRPEDPQMDFDRWLLNITVACFGLTMDELGFTDTSNRSVGQSQENVIYRRVVQPLARRYGEFLTWVVQQRFDPRLQVTWGGIAETEDLMQKVNLLRVGVEVGAISPTYLAREMGWGVETEVPAYITPQGGAASIVVVEDIPQLREMNLQNAKTAQDQQAAALKISQSQGTELDNQIEQQKQQAANPFGMFGGGEGDESGGSEGGAASSEQDNGSASNNESGGASGEDKTAAPSSGKSPSSPSASAGDASADTGEGEDDEGDSAEQQVDQLIASAKDKKGKAAARAQASDADLPAQLEELRRYRVVVTKALKRGKAAPAFESAILPADLHDRLAADLVPCRTVEEVQPCFAQAKLDLLRHFNPSQPRGPGGKWIAGVGARLASGIAHTHPAAMDGEHVAHLTDGTQIQHTETTLATMAEWLGHPVSLAEAAELTGATPGSHITLFDQSADRIDFLVQEHAPTGSQYPAWFMRGQFVRDANNKPQIYIDEARNDRQQQGTMTTLIARMASAAHDHGVASIALLAAGQGNGTDHADTSGFYAWPRMGFDARLQSFIRDGNPNGPITPHGRALLDRLTDSPFAHSARISDIISTPGGAAWWRKYGMGGHMEFDTEHPSGRSLKVLRAYLKAKGMR